LITTVINFAGEDQYAELFFKNPKLGFHLELALFASECAPLVTNLVGQLPNFVVLNRSPLVKLVTVQLLKFGGDQCYLGMEIFGIQLFNFLTVLIHA
jgi:hypothetical protein